MSSAEMVSAAHKAKRQMDAELGRRVHMLMWDRGVTQTALGNAIGIDQPSLGKRLRGVRGWSLDEVVMIAGVFDVSVSYLFGETENPHPVNPDGGNGGSWENRTPDILLANPSVEHMAEVIQLRIAS